MPYTYGKSVASTLLKFKGNIQSLWMVWRNQNVIESDSEAKKCTCPHPKNEIKQVSTHKMNWISQSEYCSHETCVTQSRTVEDDHSHRWSLLLTLLLNIQSQRKLHSLTGTIPFPQSSIYISVPSWIGQLAQLAFKLPLEAPDFCSCVPVENPVILLV